MSNLPALPSRGPAQVAAQCTLLQGQLAQLATELRSITPDSAQHLALTERAASLSAQLARLQAGTAQWGERPW
jgi:hypothetical protein